MKEPVTFSKLLAMTGMLSVTHIDGNPQEPQPDTPGADEHEVFDTHLGRCERCRNHPFALCKTGERLLKEAAAQCE
jgi:hypothetical protein